MPLPPSTAERKPLHRRKVVCDGYERADGLFDIEGWLIDTKHTVSRTIERNDIPPGEPIHSMGLRLTVDDTYTIREVAAAMDFTPMDFCHGVPPNFQALVGIQLTSGLRKKVQEAVGGKLGCTHLIELVGHMATVTFQTIRGKDPLDPKRHRPGTVPTVMNSCRGWGDDGPMIKNLYPPYYVGTDK